MAVATECRPTLVARMRTKSPLRRSKACIRMPLAQAQRICPVDEARMMGHNPVPKLVLIHRRRSEARSMRAFWRRRRLGVSPGRLRCAGRSTDCDQASLLLFSATWMLHLCGRDLRGQWSHLRLCALWGLDIVAEGAGSRFYSAWAY
jgi:hypothetical protein